MPHVNDRRRLSAAFGSSAAEQGIRVGAGQVLDTESPGQQEFQALLMWCLLSPVRTLGWDTRSGRSFQDMHYYFSSVSSRPDCLFTRWTLAARVASYLLPEVRCDRESLPSACRIAGIPGLRLQALTRRTIRLVHLPTGGALELSDYHPAENAARRNRELQAEIGDSSESGGKALYRRASLAAEEEAALADWALAEYAPPLSAIITRLNLLWDHAHNNAELDVNPRIKCPRLSWWAGPSLSQMTSLLTRDPVTKVAGARSVPGERGSATAMLWVGDAVLELRGPRGE